MGMVRSMMVANTKPIRPVNLQRAGTRSHEIKAGFTERRKTRASYQGIALAIAQAPKLNALLWPGFGIRESLPQKSSGMRGYASHCWGRVLLCCLATLGGVPA